MMMPTPPSLDALVSTIRRLEARVAHLEDMDAMHRRRFSLTDDETNALVGLAIAGMLVLATVHIVQMKQGA